MKINKNKISGAIANGIDCLFPLPAVSLPLYRNVMDFCTLILCSARLMNLCVSSSSVLESLLGLVQILSCYLQKEYLVFFREIWIFLIFIQF